MSKPDNDNIAVPPRIGGELSHVLERAGEAIINALIADPEDARAMAEAAASIFLADQMSHPMKDATQAFLEDYAQTIGVAFRATAQEPTDER